MGKVTTNSQEENRLNHIIAKRNLIKTLYLNESFFKSFFASLIFCGAASVLMSIFSIIPGMAIFFSLGIIFTILTGYVSSDKYEIRVLNKIAAFDKEINELKSKLGIVDEKLTENIDEKFANKNLIKELIKTRVKVEKCNNDKTKKSLKLNKDIYEEDDSLTLND